MKQPGALLVIVEKGAILPTWVGRCQDRVSDVVVLAAAYDESPKELACRVVQRIETMSSTDVTVSLAVLVAAEEPLPAAYADSRVAMAHAVLEQFLRRGRGQLLFVTDDQISPEGRFQLLSLAGILAQDIRGTRIGVGIRFGAAEEDSPPAELERRMAGVQVRPSRRPPPASGELLKADSADPSSVAPPRKRVDSVG